MITNIQRWVRLHATSPSGKVLFVCACCGRTSPTPEKNCRTIADPDETWRCSVWHLEHAQRRRDEQVEHLRYLVKLGFGLYSDPAAHGALDDLCLFATAARQPAKPLGYRFGVAWSWFCHLIVPACAVLVLLYLWLRGEL